MTSLFVCPICQAPTPANRITTEVWCCSIACFRTFHHVAEPGSPTHEEVVVTA